MLYMATASDSQPAGKIRPADSANAAVDTPSEDATASRWTFLTNHSHVLVLLHNNPELVLRKVALLVGITERAVQRIIHDLESDGFIERERVGRRNRYVVLVDQHLRHPIESHRKIGDLLDLFSQED
jgi:DNA-binding MarR family transcriptional regulator